MKKIILFVFIFILVGCSNNVTFDFNDNIKSNINLEFSIDDYKNNQNNRILSDKDAEYAINALRRDQRAFTNSYSELMEETKYENNNGNYKIDYEYTYDYDNFGDNSILRRCFENFIYDESEESISVLLSGNSICAPFTLNIKANNRMLKNNSNNNDYSWIVKKENNNIYFSISKSIVNNNSTDYFNIIYIIIGLIAFIVFIVIKKKSL